MRTHRRVQHRMRDMGLAWKGAALAAVVAVALLVGCTTGASTNTSGVGAASMASSQPTAGAASSTSRIATTAPPAKYSGQATRPKTTSHAVSHAHGPQPFEASQLDPRVTQATIRTTIAVTGYTTRVRPPESYTEPIKLSADASTTTRTRRPTTNSTTSSRLRWADRATSAICGWSR